MKSIVKAKEIPVKPEFPTLKTNKVGDVILITGYSSSSSNYFNGTVVALSTKGPSFTLGHHADYWLVEQLNDFHGEVILSSD
jgi:hypothetical protein